MKLLNKNKSPLIIAISLLLVISTPGCEKFVDVGTPKTQVTTTTVYSSDQTAISAISGIYSRMVSNRVFAGGGDGSITMLAGLSSDELIGYFEGRIAFEQNAIAPNTSFVKSGLWQPAYQSIYYANAVLEGLSNSKNVTEATKRQLEGEAKFIRAFCHFYLVNLFGEIPIASTTDYRVNAVSARQPVDNVYQQIIGDLIDAQNLLMEDYITGDERVRPNKYTATALLARVYLYKNDWANAEIQATSVIDHTSMYSLVTLNEAFLSSSLEAIWQLKPVNPGRNTNEAGIFIITSTPGFVSLTDTIFRSFEPGDNRKTSWIGTIKTNGITYYYPNKYKIDEGSLSEYSIVLRLSEQYLIRAEARAQQGNLTESILDIDMVRERAGLSLIADTNPDIDKSDLLLAIEQERKVELFAEWGHRWFDLKRTNRADAVLASIKSPTWESTDVLYPIPQSERENNANLSQNQGY